MAEGGGFAMSFCTRINPLDFPGLATMANCLALWHSMAGSWWMWQLTFKHGLQKEWN
jgi:hypothetical protein